MKKIIAAFLVILLTVIGGAAYFYYQEEDAHISFFYQRMGERAEEKGNIDRARFLYTEAVANNGENVQARLKLSKMYLADGDIAVAKQLIKEALSLKNAGIELYLQMSLCYAKELQFESARSVMENAEGDLVRFRLSGMSPAYPQASPPPGTYNEYISVSLTVPEGALCYYAEDGRKPEGRLAKLYTGPIALRRGENTLTAVTVAENGLVSEYLTLKYTLTDIVEKVVFKDSSVEKAARAALSAGGGDIMTNDLWQIEELILYDAQIKSLDDLKLFKKLSSLNLKNVTLPEDLSVLTELPLQQLTLSACGLRSEDLEFLKGMPELSKLDLSKNLITDMQFAKELYNLKSLNVSENKIQSVMPIHDKKNLESLDISKNAVEDVSPLGGLSGLKSLWASDNRISGIGNISYLFALEVLDMSDNMLVDITPLRQMTRIRLLNLSRNRIREIAPLSGFLTTSELILTSNHIEEIKALSNMISLEVLDIRGNPVSDLSPALKLPMIQAVFSDIGDESVSVSGTVTGITIDEE